MDIVQKHPWIVGIVAICVTITLWLFGMLITKLRARKAFTYRTLDNINLVRKTAQQTSNIKILFRDQEVTDVRLIMIELRNNGALPISDKDFYRPVKLIAPGGCEILEAEVSASYPKSFKPSFNVTTAEAQLVPTLINQGWWMMVNVLVTMPTKQDLLVEGEIFGIVEIQRLRDSDTVVIIRWGVATCGWFIWSIAGAVKWLAPSNSGICLVFQSIGIVVTVGGLFSTSLALIGHIRITSKSRGIEPLIPTPWKRRAF